MDKINALLLRKFSKHIALVDLKAMNKKFVFIVVRNELRKMAPIREFRITGVQIDVVGKNRTRN